MNDIIDTRRFTLFFKKTIVERPIQTIGVTGLLLVLSLMMYTIAKKSMGFGAAQNLTFIWGLVGGDFFLTSFAFGYFGTNASGSSYLTLPVSYFEKWLTCIIIVGILYPIIFILFFHTVDAIFISSYHHSLDPSSIFFKEQYESAFTFNLNGILAWRVYALCFFFVGVMLTGGLYFNKAPLIKTLIAFCIVAAIIFGLNWAVAMALFRNVKDAGPYDHVTLAVGRETGVLLLPTGLEKFFHVAISYAIPAFLWLVPLIRLKEKEF